MAYNAYKLINLDTFLASGLVSKKITAFLTGVGQKDVLITKGNAVSILYDGIFLSLQLNNKNPFEFDNHAVFLDPDRNIWLGIKSS